MKIGIYGKAINEENLDFYTRLFSDISKQNVEISYYEPFYEAIKNKIILSDNINLFKSHNDLKGNVDYLFSIGGDGTILDAVSIVKDLEIPILGFNTGRLGFLSSISKKEIDLAISYFFHNKFTIESRSLIKLESNSLVFSKNNFALNEFTIHKKDYSSMITIHVYINNNLLNTYWADGLIISTPTGSTAYSMSCGGPILSPDSENFIITPIASHNLTVRPIVVPDKSEIKIKVEGRIDSFLVTLDSRQETIDSEVELKIVKENFIVKLVQLTNKNFFNTIREKLMWGIDKRN